MPTGLTAKIYEGEETSLREFALTCAAQLSPCHIVTDRGSKPMPMDKAPVIKPEQYRRQQLRREEEEPVAHPPRLRGGGHPGAARPPGPTAQHRHHHAERATVNSNPKQKSDMRTIRFRGQRIDNGEWEYGDLVHDNIGGCYIFPTECEGLYRNNKVVSQSVGQFTGLKDKNGRDIYEGDIYWRDPAKGWSSQAYCVDYCNGAWIGKDSDGVWLTLIEEDSDLICDQLDYIEVVGNIHDNPELLNAER